MRAARLFFLLPAGWLLPAVAWAMHMESYDLPGLVLRSKAIVLAERGPYPSEGPTSFKVKKVYLGPVLQGQQFTLYLGAYDLKGNSVGRSRTPSSAG